jgi:excisionase family DNA binding protein
MNDPVLDERWLSVDDVSAYLGIRRGTVYKWVERRGLPARKVGRLLKFRRSEVDKWVEERSSRTGKGPDGDLSMRLLRAAAPEIENKFGVRKIGIFGSTVRGEAGPDSDIDVLVELDDPTFDRYMDLKFFLEDLFGRPCDLVLEDSLKEGIRSKALGEVLYA